MLFDPGGPRRALTRDPDHLVTDGHIGSPAIDQPWKQEVLRLHPSPVAPQFFEQSRTQRHIAVAPALALTHMNHHALAVDVGGLQLAEFGAANARRVQRHQHGAVQPVGGGGQQLADFLPAEHGR
jgi:hypothetical protein